MKDGLGQDIAPGDKVVWVGGKQQYSGVKVRIVEKLTPKMVRLKTTNTRNPNELGECVGPETVVVVNRLIAELA